MNKLIVQLLICAVPAAGLPAAASSINVTNSSQVTVGTNDDLIFYLAVDYSGCGRNSAYPAEIEVLLGSMPLGGPLSPVPGTSGVYQRGILFDGSLQSPTGSAAFPLIDPNALRLGLQPGQMLLTPGERSGGAGSGAIDLLSAAVTIQPQDRASMFGSGEVVIDLHNAGEAITFGDPNSTLARDFSASMVSADGSTSVGARVLSVACVHTPEPGTLGLLITGFSIIAMRLRRARQVSR